jgi:hypothetical protein
LRAQVDKSIIKYLFHNKHNLIIAGESEISRNRLIEYIKRIDTKNEYSILNADEKIDDRTYIIKELNLSMDNNREPVVSVAENMKMNIFDVKKKFEMLIDCKRNGNDEHYYLIHL